MPSDNAELPEGLVYVALEIPVTDIKRRYPQGRPTRPRVWRTGENGLDDFLSENGQTTKRAKPGRQHPVPPGAFHPLHEPLRPDFLEVVSSLPGRILLGHARGLSAHAFGRNAAGKTTEVRGSHPYLRALGLTHRAAVARNPKRSRCHWMWSATALDSGAIKSNVRGCCTPQEALRHFLFPPRFQAPLGNGPRGEAGLRPRETRSIHPRLASTNIEMRPLCETIMERKSFRFPAQQRREMLQSRKGRPHGAQQRAGYRASFYMVAALRFLPAL